MFARPRSPMNHEVGPGGSLTVFETSVFTLPEEFGPKSNCVVLWLCGAKNGIRARSGCVRFFSQEKNRLNEYKFFAESILFHIENKRFDGM